MVFFKFFVILILLLSLYVHSLFFDRRSQGHSFATIVIILYLYKKHLPEKFFFVFYILSKFFRCEWFAFIISNYLKKIVFDSLQTQS